MEPMPIAAYVLAGGRSSRMGQDKALLSLGGRPLVQHAVSKLRQLTEEVYLLGSRPELAPFAPLVPDLREGCGPLGGIEAALAHTSREWILVLPVDMPFLPTALLHGWARRVLRQDRARVALFVVEDVPQPTLCLLHREITPWITAAAEQGRYKLYPVLEEAARALAGRFDVAPGRTLLRWSWDEAGAALASLAEEERKLALTPAQQAASPLWFANLNTLEEFAGAQLHLDALEL